MEPPPISINDLPNELLEKIFHAGVDIDRNERLPRSLISYCAVNSRWRAICLQSPELWTDIRIPMYHPRPECVIARVTTSLLRSRFCLLDVSLDITLAMRAVPVSANSAQDETVPHDVSRLMLPILEHTLALPHSTIPRIRRFHFTSEIPFISGDVLFICVRLSQFDAPQLTDISLRFAYIPTNSPNPPVVEMNRYSSLTIFRSVPKLRVQRLCGVDVHFPLRGLTTLEIADVRPDEVSLGYLARYSPALEELRLVRLHPMMNAVDLQSNSSQPKFSFPALRTLIVSFTPRTRFTPGTCALALLSSPNLQYLDIRGPSVPSDPATAFPNPSRLPNLHTLCLKDIVFTNPSQPQEVHHDPSFFLGFTSVRHLQLIDTPPQALFPNQFESKPKRLLRSRSSELKVPSTDGVMHPLSCANELNHRVLLKQKGELLKLSFSFPSQSTPSTAGLGTTSESHTHTHWPNLHTLTLSTIRAQDVLWLCELVASRPGEIKTVYLSHTAKRNLAELVRIDSECTMTMTMRTRGEDGGGSDGGDGGEGEGEDDGKSDGKDGDMDDMDPVAWLERRVEVREYRCVKDRTF
ncbi:hypothetical protein EV361DRAFT_191683 [Lentinula raphanica]|nr:hypothetical protein EV361DRAFT_191683 [Lentinula raphanica]